MERYKARVLEAANPDIVLGDDGYYVFWPTTNRGYFNAESLRVVAGELDRRNAAWDEQVRRMGLGSNEQTVK